jgi:predicted transcriptional regulator
MIPCVQRIGGFMGRPATGNREYTIQNIWNQHHEIMRLAVMGLKQVEIARKLGVSEVMVSYTLNSPIVKRKLDIMQGARDINAVDVAKEIHRLAPKAIAKLDELLDSQVEAIAFKASVDILDRAGHGAIKKEMSLSGHLTKDDIDEIKNRAKEIGLCKVIDISSQPA